ncbi:hypothetical protein LQ331_20615 [Stenotrophomonas maltophilia]|nr:hypothetical protein LQ331_20615 [Stenotrophomonas maltophilia]
MYFWGGVGRGKTFLVIFLDARSTYTASLFPPLHASVHDACSSTRGGGGGGQCEPAKSPWNAQQPP